MLYTKVFTEEQRLSQAQTGAANTVRALSLWIGRSKNARPKR